MKDGMKQGDVIASGWPLLSEFNVWAQRARFMSISRLRWRTDVRHLNTAELWWGAERHSMNRLVTHSICL